MLLRGASRGITVVFLYLILTSFPLFYLSTTSATDSLSLVPLDSGPSINWPSEEEVLFVDDLYTGQSHETFEWTVWINDSLGVDTVLFRFRWWDDEDWINRTGARMEGDVFRGKYKGSLTWPAPSCVSFHLKIFANNTLGQWNETSPMLVIFGYFNWYPSTTSPTSSTSPTTSQSLIFDPSLTLFLVFSMASLFTVIGVWRFRQLRRNS